MSFIQNNWALILVLFLSGAMLLWPILQRRFSPMKEVGTLFVTHLINKEDAVLLDIRERKEVTAGRLPNAIHIPLSELPARVSELAKYSAKPVVTYCERGQRSRSAAGMLEKAGLKNLYHLQGGIKAWKDAGLPLQR
jgi:rhodanese-related sulfurtransferase